ncbi:hypothetical protein CDAR_95601 [Caerostris darwini]|uniref:Uncharacterized protein n=1 Tax=Caerostris darwini TaxID=1538125 RepID=A0AAV4UQ57_9ARAC|nr:hypothetical protein CDAR_583071 [Caerostris darwini]GIY59883.1 hypothetical protein CDAR_95601 [Caerostris darwini]
MLKMKFVMVAVAILFLIALMSQHTEAGKMKKLLAAAVIAKSLKPRFIPLPIPIPFKLKINKGEKIVPYPVKSSYGGGGGYGGGGFGGGDGGYGGGGGGYGGGGNDWW